MYPLFPATVIFSFKKTCHLLYHQSNAAVKLSYSVLNQNKRSSHNALLACIFDFFNTISFIIIAWWKLKICIRTPLNNNNSLGPSQIINCILIPCLQFLLLRFDSIYYPVFSLVISIISGKKYYLLKNLSVNFRSK